MLTYAEQQRQAKNIKCHEFTGCQQGAGAFINLRVREPPPVLWLPRQEKLCEGSLCSAEDNNTWKSVLVLHTNGCKPTHEDGGVVGSGNIFNIKEE